MSFLCLSNAGVYNFAMSQPIEISDALILEAQTTGATAARSVSEQIEFWAFLGKAIEPLLENTQAHALFYKSEPRPVSECLEAVSSPEGRERLAAYLNSRPFPHYQPAPGQPGLLIRIEKDGTHTRGRFVAREFRAE